MSNNSQPTKQKILSIQKSIYPLDYDKNNPMSGFKNWTRYIKIEVSKSSNTDRAQKFLRQQNLISAAAENHQNGPCEMSNLFHEALNIIKHGR